MNIQEALQSGIQHHQAGRLRKAEEIYRQVLAVQPNNPVVLHLLGLLAFGAGQADTAISLIRRAIAIDPSSAVFHTNLGHALALSGRLEEAVAAYRSALALQPAMVDAVYNLGTALAHLGQLDEAIASFRTALKIKPEADIYINLGNALRASGRLDEAIANFRQAIKLKPDDPVANYNLGTALLLCGNFNEGWIGYESRLRAAQLELPSLPRPRWQGEPLNGRRIFIYTEQGFGDSIQFVRYVPLVANLGGKITLACPRELSRLFRKINGIDKLISEGESIPECDVHCSLLSLPLIMRTNEQTIPHAVPYLEADGQLAAKWNGRLSNDRLNVGVVWAGRQALPGERERAVPLEKLLSLAQIDSIRSISLQKTPDPLTVTQRIPFIDWTGELGDFADTAALIQCLDLVITVDTAVAHLAGALGKPVWVLLPFVPDWRWMLNRTDSPWYPTMRLYRQPNSGDWQTPIGDICRDLQNWK